MKKHIFPHQSLKLLMVKWADKYNFVHFTIFTVSHDWNPYQTFTEHSMLREREINCFAEKN